MQRVRVHPTRNFVVLTALGAAAVCLNDTGENAEKASLTEELDASVIVGAKFVEIVSSPNLPSTVENRAKR